jgi:phospholipase A1
MPRFLLFSLCLLAGSALAADNGYQQCLLSELEKGDPQQTLELLKQRCRQQQTDADRTPGAISQRLRAERQYHGQRHVILPHKRNYILPLTHTSRVNREAYLIGGEAAEELKHTEAKLQVSLKVPLNSGDLFRPYDGLYFGFTLQSWWQVYADKLSAPFRETNYQPELFYLTGLDWQPWGGNTGIAVGIEHQSNGRSQLLSRSWNRVYTSLLFEKDNFALSLRPWYRIPEDDKANPLDADGDDNPDIEKFMGHFELKSAYRRNNQEFSLMWRNNLRSDNKGAIELGWSFPLMGHLKGYLQYFNGYGESLLDYNHHNERIGVGILLTEIL